MASKTKSQQSQEMSEIKSTTQTQKTKSAKEIESVIKYPRLNISIGLTLEDGTPVRVNKEIDFEHLLIASMYQDAPGEIYNALNQLGINPFMTLVRDVYQKKVDKFWDPPGPTTDFPKLETDTELVED